MVKSDVQEIKKTKVQELVKIVKYKLVFVIVKNYKKKYIYKWFSNAMFGKFL